ncbi:MAG: hypothetical protein ACI4KL_05690 [Lentihominibacter sp.]
MNSFERFNTIRNEVNRSAESISNVSVVQSESGFRCIHILWLYPDVMNIHGGRGDIMGLLHFCSMMDVPVEIRRCDSLRQEIDWQWPHMIFMTAGELKCVPDVISALKLQLGNEEDDSGLKGFISGGGMFIANGSSGGVLGKSVRFIDGRTISGLGFLDMEWIERESVWGDDIWIETEDGLEIIGNQIQVADVKLNAGQKPLGKLVYGRGNDGASGEEGARSGNVIYTGILGPLITKNPEFAASLIRVAAAKAGVEVTKELTRDCIETEIQSAEYIKKFMKNKMK